MSTLLEHQNKLWEIVRSRGAVSSEGFDESAAFPAAARLEIYRTAYWVRQIRVLEELFGGVRSRVDDAAFRDLAVRFLRERPSTHAAIELVGGDYVDWLVVNEPDLASIAAIDFTSWEVSVAPDAVPVSLGDARSIGLEGCRLTIGPHVRTVRVPSLALWRDGRTVRRVAIGAEERDALETARDGIPFVVLCDRLAALGGADRIFAILAAWFDRSWIVSLDREEET